MVSFTVNTAGSYTIRWTPVADATGKAGYWTEAVIGHIKITQNSGTRSVLVLGDEGIDGTTGLEEVATDKSEETVYYNINGSRTSTPAKGVYIRNGKKILVR